MENELSAYQRKFPSKFVQPNQKLGYRNELKRAMNKNTAAEIIVFTWFYSKYLMARVTFSKMKE